MQDSGINVFFQGINSLLLLKGLWTTLHISLLSAGLSIPLGILLGIFMTLKNPIARVASQDLPRNRANYASAGSAIRCLFRIHSSLLMESLRIGVQLLFLPFWGTGEMGDLLRGALISIPKTQYERAQVLGLSKLQTMRLRCSRRLFVN